GYSRVMGCLLGPGSRPSGTPATAWRRLRARREGHEPAPPDAAHLPPGRSEPRAVRPREARGWRGQEDRRLAYGVHEGRAVRDRTHRREGTAEPVLVQPRSLLRVPPPVRAGRRARPQRRGEPAGPAVRAPNPAVPRGQGVGGRPGRRPPVAHVPVPRDGLPQVGRRQEGDGLRPSGAPLRPGGRARPGRALGLPPTPRGHVRRQAPEAGQAVMSALRTARPGEARALSTTSTSSAAAAVVVDAMIFRKPSAI
ncbi:hypothetical protein THAOC_30568, partial [Thalassiosira oceanica]